MNHKISIIVPIYNTKEYLVRCIESIINQTYTNIEIILVNDGSTDGSELICNKYKKIDNRIILINKKNGGLSDARNYGISIATGEYIGFVDSDDYIHPKMYELLYEGIISSKADISICEYEDVFNTKTNLYHEEELRDRIDLTSIEALYKLYSHNAITYTVVWNKLYKRELFIKNKFKVGKVHEDEFIIHNLYNDSSNISYISNKLYLYTHREGSIINQKFNLSRLDKLDAIKERINLFYNIKQLDLKYITEFNYINLFFYYYKKIKFELENENILIDMHKEFQGMVISLLRNPLYNIKEKLVWILFSINPNIYIKYFT